MPESRFSSIYGIKRQNRLVYLFFSLTFPFGLLICKLAGIQVLSIGSYAVKASHIEYQELALEDYLRGEILDRNGSPLTGGYMADRVVVFPVAMSDREEVIRGLSEIFDVPEEEMEKYVSSKPVVLPFRPTVDQCRDIRKHNWSGVAVLPFYHRYGQQPLAAHVVGHLGKMSSLEIYEKLSAGGNKRYSLDDWVGVMGLEKIYEPYLKGTQSERRARVLVDAKGRYVVGSGLQFKDELEDPERYDVVTTIDRRIQQVVEEVMDERVKKGAVVVMQAGTGDILAVASRPSFNPDPASMRKLASTREDEVFLDQGTAFFQPGSIFKVVVAAAAMEEGIVEPTDHFYCAGEAARPVKCWYGPGHGEIDLRDALAQSCNVAFVELGLRLGAEKLIRYARLFGLEKRDVVGYPLPDDKRQDLNLIAAPHNLVNSSIGQGPVLVTPVQVTAVMNAIVNDGIYVQPRLVRGIRSSRTVRDFGEGKRWRAISERTAVALREMLCEVTLSGLGTRAYVDGFGSAGKTGSAEVAGADTVNAWFTGYSPVKDPAYVVTVLVREGKSGGDTAAPVFREIMEKILLLSNL